MGRELFDPKPGDHVKVRQWDDMAEEFGVSPYSGWINCGGIYFTEGMKKFCGMPITLQDANFETKTVMDAIVGKNELHIYKGGCVITRDMLEYDESYELDADFQGDNSLVSFLDAYATS